MGMRDHIDQLTELGACKEGKEWAEKYKSAQTAWRYCRRGNWLLWVLGMACDGDEMRKKVVLAACECARLALVHVPDGEDRPRIAIETAERWARGEATIDDVRTATHATYAAANAANANAAANAAAATAAANANATIATATYANAANAIAAYANIKSETLSQCADIVREHFPQAPEVKGA